VWYAHSLRCGVSGFGCEVAGFGTSSMCTTCGVAGERSQPLPGPRRPDLIIQEHCRMAIQRDGEEVRPPWI